MDEFRKYLSERLDLYADRILELGNPALANLDQPRTGDREVLAAAKEKAIKALGYYLKPSELFNAVVARGNRPNPFILTDLVWILNKIGESIMRPVSGDDFDNLLNKMDFTSTKLGRTETARKTLTVKIMGHLDTIDFHLDDTNFNLGR